MGRIALVTGGSGFVGGHLSERLVADGWEVRVLDRREPGLDAEVDWVEGDVRDLCVVARAAAGSNVVFHLASTVGVDMVLADPVEVIDVVVNGTRQVLEAAASAGAALVSLSTSEVLGRNPAIPWSEDADRNLGSPLVDRWAYASAKAAAEHVVIAGSATRDVAATVVRPFNVYGPRQEQRFVVPLMLRAAMRGEPIRVHGDGQQTRCFTYVDDLVEALVSVGNKPGLGRLLHIGTAEEISMLRLAYTIAGLVGREPSILFDNPQEHWGEVYEDPPFRLPDLSSARTILGWEPLVSLEDGLRRTISWQRSCPEYAQASWSGF